MGRRGSRANRGRLRLGHRQPSPGRDDASRVAASTCGGFKQLDRISVGVFDLHLAARGTGFQVVAKRNPRVPQRRDARGKIHGVQHDAIPAAGFLAFAAGERTRAGCSGAAEQERSAVQGQRRELRQVLVLQLETEMLRVERSGARDILHLVANTVNVFEEPVR